MVWHLHYTYITLQKLPNEKSEALGMDRKDPIVPNIGIFVQMSHFQRTGEGKG